MQGNCTDPPPEFAPPLRLPLRPMRPLQCLMVTQKTALLAWQAGNVLLENLYFVVYHESVSDNVEVGVLSNVPSTAVGPDETVNLFLQGVTVQGDGGLSNGLRVVLGGRVHIDGAPRLSSSRSVWQDALCTSHLPQVQNCCSREIAQHRRRCVVLARELHPKSSCANARSRTLRG